MTLCVVGYTRVGVRVCFAVDEVIFGAPPKKKRAVAGLEVEEERNPIVDLIMEEKSFTWSHNKRSSEGRWSARGKRHTQVHTDDDTHCTPFAISQGSFADKKAFHTCSAFAFSWLRWTHSTISKESKGSWKNKICDLVYGQTNVHCEK